MSADNRPFNWVRFLVRFTFGAIFGALVGFYLLTLMGALASWPFVLTAVALHLGLIAGFYGDKFWESLRGPDKTYC